jgi:hypothetical protein
VFFAPGCHIRRAPPSSTFHIRCSAFATSKSSGLVRREVSACTSSHIRFAQSTLISTTLACPHSPTTCHGVSTTPQQAHFDDSTHRNVFCVPGSKNHCAAGIAPIDPGFFVMRAPCHVEGRPAADMHSFMRVNGFLYTQSDVMCIRTKNGGWRGWGLTPATPAVAGRSAVARQGRLVQVKTKTRCGIAILCINGAAGC